MMILNNSYPDDLGFIEFRDEWLQDLLWSKQNPRDFYQTSKYNKTDMMKHLEIMSSQGMVWFWGSKKLGLVMRVNAPNKYVIEPHILGDARHWRTIQPVAMDFAFNYLQLQKINVYTPYKSIKGVLERYGFVLEGILEDSYLLSDDTLATKYILGLTKKRYDSIQSTPTPGDASG